MRRLERAADVEPLEARVTEGVRRPSLAGQGSLSVVSVAVQGLARLLTSLLVGRTAGPAVLGAVMSAIAVAQIAVLCGPGALGSAASKFVARALGAGSSEERAAVLARLRRLTVIVTACLAAGATPAWWVVSDGDVQGLLGVVVLVIGYAGYTFVRGVYYGSGAVVAATRWDVAASSIALMGVVCALLAGVRNTLLILPLAGAYLVFALVGWPYDAGGRTQPQLDKEITGFVRLATIGTLAGTGFLQASVVLARVAEGQSGAGQYAAALALATPGSLIGAASSLVLYPSMSAAYGRGDDASIRRRTDLATRGLALVMVALIGALALSSELLVSLVWGERFRRSSEVLPLLLCGVLASTLAGPSMSSLTSRGQRGMAMGTGLGLAGLVVGGVVWLVTVPRFGIVAVAGGYLAAAMTTCVLALALASRRERLEWSGFALRLASASALLAGLWQVQQREPAVLWRGPALSAAFCVLWLALSVRDLGSARRQVTRLGRARRR